MKTYKQYGSRYFVFLLFAAFLTLLVLFWNFGIAPINTLKFIAGILFLVYFPGQSLLSLAHVEIDRLERFSLSLALGLVSSTLLYKITFWLGLEILFYLWLVSHFIHQVWRRIKNPPEKSTFSFRITSVGVIFFIIVLLVLTMLSVDNYRNGRVQDDGSIVMNLHYHDGFFRNAYIRELSHSIPPTMSFAAGFPVSHHYNQDLFVAIFYRHLGIGVLDLQHRLVITFFFVFLLFASFTMIRRLTGSGATGNLGTFLIIFGSGGFAYAATWLLGIPQWGNIFFSLYFLDITAHNTILTAAAILFSGLFCLIMYMDSRKRSWLILSSLLLALVLEYKMFMIGPIIGALFTAGLILFFFQRRKELLLAWGLTTAFALPLLVTAFLSNKGGPQYKFSVKLVEWITFTLQNLEFHSINRAWAGLVNNTDFSLGGVLLVIPILLLFFLGGYGLTSLAIPLMVRDLFSLKKIEPARLLIMTLFAGCILYFFFIYTTFAGRPRSYLNIYNYFISVMLLCVLFADMVFRFLRKRRSASKIGVIGLIILLSIPNTVRFMQAKLANPQPRPFPKTFLQAAEWMNKNSDKGTVIIHPEYLRYVCYFTDSRVVLDRSGHSYLTWSLTTRQIAKRSADIDGFFDDPVLGGSILGRYGVSYIWLMRDESLLASESAEKKGMIVLTPLAAQTIRKYRQTYRLEPRFANEDHLLYQVVELPDSEKEVFVLVEEDGRREFVPFAEYIKK